MGQRLAFSGTAVGGAAQTIRYYSSYDSANLLHHQTTALTSSGEIAPSSYFSSITSGSVNQSLYSLTQAVIIEGTPVGQPGATYTIEATLTLASEPGVASLAPCGIAVLYITIGRPTLGGKQELFCGRRS